MLFKGKNAKTMQKENFHKNPIKSGTFCCDINHFSLFVSIAWFSLIAYVTFLNGKFIVLANVHM